jgi:hypothetical protein
LIKVYVYKTLFVLFYLLADDWSPWDYGEVILPSQIEFFVVLYVFKSPTA